MSFGIVARYLLLDQVKKNFSHIDVDTLSQNALVRFDSGYLRAVLSCTLLLFLVFPYPANSQEDENSVYSIQAALLYRFAQNIEWPDETFKNSKDNINFCVTGEDPFGQMLDQIITSNTIGGKKGSILKITKDTELKDRNCNILYISKSEKNKYIDIIKELTLISTFTVSDINGFSTNGGMLEYIIKDDLVRYKVNLKSVKKAGIKISSQLLSYAEEVME